MTEIYEYNGSFFAIDFKDTNGWLEGSVSPLVNWSRTNSESGLSYESKEGDLYSEKNDDCVSLCDFCFTWRGCWDETFFFTQQEYSFDDLFVLVLIWKEAEKRLKEYIKSNYPNHEYKD